MAAVIRLPDGTEAKLLTPNGEWECVDDLWRRELVAITKLLPFAYYPDPVGDLARAVAKEVGAEVIHVDPVQQRKRSPGVAY